MFKRKEPSEWRRAVLAMDGTKARELKKAARLAPRSEKTSEKYEVRRELVAEMLKSESRCQAGPVIYGHLIDLGLRPGEAIGLSAPYRALSCAGASSPVDVHELMPRSAGGDINDRSNCIAVCRVCHDWIHQNPRAARKIGLLKSRYE